MPTSSEASGIDRSTTCAVREHGDLGNRGNFMLIRVPKKQNVYLLTYRDRIVFLTDIRTFFHVYWRFSSHEVHCRGKGATVKSIDEIRIKAPRDWAGAVIIDQSGIGISPRQDAKSEFAGSGGPFLPGASGRGVKVSILGPTPEESLGSSVAVIGSDRPDHFRLKSRGQFVTLYEGDGKDRHPLISNWVSGGWVTLTGGGGNDYLTGRHLGSDRWIRRMALNLFGGSGDDRVLGHHGKDERIAGGPGDDFLWGGEGNDGDTGNGYGFFAGPGNDLVYAGPGDDDIRLGSGSDKAWGGSGDDDFYAVDSEKDWVYCGGQSEDRVLLDLGLDVPSKCPTIE